jgi:hypothetical protein
MEVQYPQPGGSPVPVPITKSHLSDDQSYPCSHEKAPIIVPLLVSHSWTQQ